MTPFYGLGSTVSNLQNHNKKTVYFLPINTQEVLVLIWSTPGGWKADSSLEQPSGFELGTHELGIQRSNACTCYNTCYNSKLRKDDLKTKDYFINTMQKQP